MCGLNYSTKILLVCAMLFLAACGGLEELEDGSESTDPLDAWLYPSPTVGASPQPSVSPTPVEAPAPSPAATPDPVVTPGVSDIPAPTAVPTAVPSATAPISAPPTPTPEPSPSPELPVKDVGDNSASIVNVSASSDDGNLANNALDDDLSTRWSAKGEGETLDISLSKAVLISAVELAFYKGDERLAFFDLHYRKNGEWKPLLTQLSSEGHSLDKQRFVFSPVLTDGLRYVGYGNTGNMFNSLTEISLLDENLQVIPLSFTEQDATPVYTLNFNQLEPGEVFTKESVADANCSPSASNTCVRVTYTPADNGSDRQTKYDQINQGTEYTLQYDVKFDADFEFVKGGKMHGLGAANSTTGCRKQVADGWSVRIMWKQNGKAILYIYDQDREAEGVRCGREIGADKMNNKADFPEGIAFNPGEYQAVSIYVKLNSAADKRDGIAELWIDGKLYARQANLKLRGVINKDTEINKLLYNTFFGGSNDSWAPSKAVYASFDNFEVWDGKQIRNVPKP